MGEGLVRTAAVRMVLASAGPALALVVSTRDEARVVRIGIMRVDSPTFQAVSFATQARTRNSSAAFHEW